MLKVFSKCIIALSFVIVFITTSFSMPVDLQQSPSEKATPFSARSAFEEFRSGDLNRDGFIDTKKDFSGILELFAKYYCADSRKHVKMHL